MAAQSGELKQFLLRNLYRHPQVMETTLQARRIVADLFAAYLQTPGEMQSRFAQRAAHAPHATATARVVADYIAGMTDRFAVREHVRLTGLRLLDASA
jgi:dGTPase